jgi:chemotaxis methyl-accepting protein methylase
MDDQQFRQLLNYFGLSWRGYRKVRKGVINRIRWHMGGMGCHNMAAYLIELGNNEDARHICERLMTVSISRFFRDQKLWETLKNEIVIQLIERPQEKINVWIAGCASGEEVYSLRIIWEDLRSTYLHLPNMEIMATDLNPQYLERAKAGAYPSSSLKELSENLKSRYFHKKTEKHLYFVKALLKEGIILKNHNLLNDAPGPQFDLIFLRNNLLTYYKDAIKMSALKKVTNSLSDNGFLIIGSHEKLPSENRDFLSITPLSYVLRKG